jgi:hypothetical protein
VEFAELMTWKSVDTFSNNTDVIMQDGGVADIGSSRRAPASWTSLCRVRATGGGEGDHWRRVLRPELDEAECPRT